jgi:hypothetical protein
MDVSASVPGKIEIIRTRKIATGNPDFVASLEV